MVVQAPTRLMLSPGSNGWTCADLDRPDIERQWHDRRVELINGVVAEMPSPMFAHGEPLANLAYFVKAHCEHRRVEARVAVGEVDLQVSPTTRFKADGMILLPEDVLRQERQQALHRPKDHPRGVIIVPPAVVIESISLGHENHDRLVKFRDYAAFGVPYYWIVDAYRQTFDGWRLIDGRYEVEFAATAADTVTPEVFPGLSIAVGKLFA